MFTHDEKVDMLLIYGETQKNSRRAVQLYADRYPERIVPNLKIFARLELTLRENKEAFSSRKGKKLQKGSILIIQWPLFCNISKNTQKIQYDKPVVN